MTWRTCDTSYLNNEFDHSIPWTPQTILPNSTTESAKFFNEQIKRIEITSRVYVCAPLRKVDDGLHVFGTLEPSAESVPQRLHTPLDTFMNRFTKGTGSCHSTLEDITRSIQQNHVTKTDERTPTELPKNDNPNTGHIPQETESPLTKCSSI
jgi:hypothetical protein